MVRRVLSCLIVLFILGLTVPCLSQEKHSEAERAARNAGWDDAWAWGNAFAVKAYFERLYYPHAKALIEAEGGGQWTADMLGRLATLPGVRGAVFSVQKPVYGTTSLVSLQYPEGVVVLDAFDSHIFMTLEEASSKSPMMQRTVGGQVRFREFDSGKGTVAVLTRQGWQGDGPATKKAFDAISLILDEQWLIAQIPAAMGSLYRENVQLLFAAASPRNTIWEQSLGVIAGEDTLWWVGRKDVKISNTQVLWPFEDIAIPSYVHTIKKD